MVEKYPKLIQKYALQPQLCYDLMLVWEENCLDMLQPDELVGDQTPLATCFLVAFCWGNPFVPAVVFVGRPSAFQGFVADRLLYSSAQDPALPRADSSLHCDVGFRSLIGDSESDIRFFVFIHARLCFASSGSIFVFAMCFRGSFV